MRGAVKGACLLRGECEPLTASTVLDNGHRGKGELSSRCRPFQKETFLLCYDRSVKPVSAQNRNVLFQQSRNVLMSSVC